MAGWIWPAMGTPCWCDRAGQTSMALGDDVLCGNALDVRLVPTAGIAPTLDGTAGCQAAGPRAGG